MKSLLFAYIALLCNIILASGSEIRKVDVDITKSVKLNSLLEDINSFYNQNAKAQTALNPGLDTNAADTTEGNNDGNTDSSIVGNTNGNSGSNTDGNVGTTNGNTGGDIESTTGGNTSGNTGGNIVGGNTGGNSTMENGQRECVSNRGTLGTIVFVRPISKSIVVINSNFTIRWRYDTKEGYDYNFPQNTITFKLYHESDANLNSGDITQWRQNIYEKTIPLNEVEKGPVVTGNYQTYQYNWFIVPNDKGFKKQLTQGKYKLRIYADGKDIHTNPDNFPCYSDGDLQAGTTLAFHVIGNEFINNGKFRTPAVAASEGMNIPDDARMNTNMSLILTTIIAVIIILFNN